VQDQTHITIVIRDCCGTVARQDIFSFSTLYEPACVYRHRSDDVPLTHSSVPVARCCRLLLCTCLLSVGLSCLWVGWTLRCHNRILIPAEYQQLISWGRGPATATANQRESANAQAEIRDVCECYDLKRALSSRVVQDSTIVR
jgi:hypothetical protein